MKAFTVRQFFWLLAAFIAGEAHSLGQTSPVRDWTYTLLEGSTLIDDCWCGRPPIPYVLRGTFRLRFLDENPLFARYELTDIVFAAGAPPSEFRITGRGLYQVGGEVALVQDLTLELQVATGTGTRAVVLTNDTRALSRPWPMLEARTTEEFGSRIEYLRLWLEAAPIRELWFSTVSGLTPSGTLGPVEPTRVSPGDLISSTGRIVKRNAELTRQLGIMPVVPDLGLDAVDVLPGGEIVFSTEQDDFSETLGRQLQHGDLLSERGRIVKSNQELTRAFVILPPVPDVGLDAVQVRDDGEFYFSIETSIFSGTGGQLSHGDLLSDQGRIVKSNQQLLAQFHPAQRDLDYGLDAVHVWPSGEIWFSVAEGFQDSRVGQVMPGDLLSDQGYVVFHNLELTGAFKPIEDLADFGLDAVFVVSDAGPPAPAASLALHVERENGKVRLQGANKGRAFQLEKATEVQGPYLPITAILSDSAFDLLESLTEQPRAFYRLRQW
ncbi:MAG: hypothetical protein HYY24_13235 [Verrucomicrobia bacterium]|nr:hypothetical protein [Verrucomicrobiota bacterium]